MARAAFQAQASLNKQATDPTTHTPVGSFLAKFSPVPLPANSNGRSRAGRPARVRIDCHFAPESVPISSEYASGGRNRKF